MVYARRGRGMRRARSPERWLVGQGRRGVVVIRFTQETADRLVREMNETMGVEARVEPPTPADDYYAVSATLTARGAKASKRWAWAEDDAAEAVATLREILAADIDRAKTSKRFLRAERANK